MDNPSPPDRTHGVWLEASRLPMICIFMSWSPVAPSKSKAVFFSWFLRLQLLQFFRILQVDLHCGDRNVVGVLFKLCGFLMKLIRIPPGRGGHCSQLGSRNWSQIYVFVRDSSGVGGGGRKFRNTFRNTCSKLLPCWTWVWSKVFLTCEWNAKQTDTSNSQKT